MHNNSTLKLDGSEISVVDQYRFLSFIFTKKKLSLIPHFQYLKGKCKKALKLLRVITHKDWGADKQTLLKSYRILIRSKIENVAALKPYLKSLNSVHHEILRLVLGVFRRSQVESLYSEAYEPPLKLSFTK